MSEFIIPLIFLGIVIASAISKAREQKNLAERRKKRGSQKIRPEDLPEATRRMLYGTSNVPQPQRERGAAPVRVAKPRQGQSAPPQTQRAPQAAPPPRPQAAPRAPQSIQREVPQMPMRPQVMRAAPPSPQAAIEAQRRARQEAQQRVKEEAQRQRAQQAAEAKARALAARKRRQAAGREPARPACAGRGMLFGNLRDLRRGIIMSEILGQPKSMREDF